MSKLLERSPTIVRRRIKEAQDGLQELCRYISDHQAKLDALDVLHVQLLASNVVIALEAAAHELADAVCDAEAALGRL